MMPFRVIDESYSTIQQEIKDKQRPESHYEHLSGKLIVGARRSK